MKTQIRFGTFETNSSSTHSLVICSDIEYQKWKNGEMLYDSDMDEFVFKEEIIEDDEDSLESYYTYDRYFGNDYYETFHSSYVTDKGERIHCLGYYGFD